MEDDKLFAEFEKSIFPLLTRDEKGCLDCHSTDSSSNLVFAGDAKEDFLMLMESSFLSKTGTDTLLHRVSTDDKKIRMPEGDDPWTSEEIQKLKKFVELVHKHKTTSGKPADERFPRSLLEPYRGQPIQQRDNQFISYWQLKQKVRSIFDDEWVRDGRNLFEENVAAFGGADFKTRFNESREPTASFLSALETLAKDVSLRAYERRTGPFTDWKSPKKLPLTETPDQEYTAAIELLYERLLYRKPKPSETQNAYALIKEIHAAKDRIINRNHNLAFELVVADPESGMQQTRAVSLPVNGDRLEVYQQVINQTAKPKQSKFVLNRAVIGPEFELEADDPQQRFVIHNLGTTRNVSFAGIELTRVSENKDEAKPFRVPHTDWQIEGAWQLLSRRGKLSLEDKNNHKGRSAIAVPLNVKEAGRYRIEMLWRGSANNSDNVLVEVYAKGGGNRLASPTAVQKPPQGEAHFFYDCGNDSRPFFKPEVAFQFGVLEVGEGIDPRGEGDLPSGLGQGSDRVERACVEDAPVLGLDHDQHAVVLREGRLDFLERAQVRVVGAEEDPVVVREPNFGGAQAHQDRDCQREGEDRPAVPQNEFDVAFGARDGGLLLEHGANSVAVSRSLDCLVKEISNL